MRYQLTRRLLGLRATTCAVAALSALALTALAATPASAKGMLWLCNPVGHGMAKSFCLKRLSPTTAVTYAGSTRVETKETSSVPSGPPIDCFYVYPTVSTQEGENAELTGPKHNKPEAPEKAVVVSQASRFSFDCRVFAPWYPQLTLKAINAPGSHEAGAVKAYTGVALAFAEYLKKYNGGRPIVLIGHSQGSLLLIHLLQEEFDPSTTAGAELRAKLVSAVLLGGNVLVPEGKTVGGTFKNIPACQSSTEVHCVIAYSSYAKEPPEGAFFGRPNSPLLGGGTHPGEEVLCVNPTLTTQNGAVGALLPYASTAKLPDGLGELVPPIALKRKAPWVTNPGFSTAQCKHEGGATWLQIAFAKTEAEEGAAVRTDRANHHEIAVEDVPPEPAKWGLHLYDVNIALGNLIATVGEEAKAF
jgi:hypothetical protein